MSFLPFDNPHFEDNSSLDPLDALINGSWPDLHESGISHTAIDHNPNETINSRVFIEQNYLATSQQNVDKGLAGNSLIHKYRERNRKKKLLQTEKMVVQHDAEEGILISKKQNHNAKERVRRLKLNASYLALRSLLPDSRRSKKRRTAPFIIDKVLEYIPELENEIEKLILEKNSMQSVTENKQLVNQDPHSELQAGPTVSVNEVRKGEVIIQICMRREQKNVFSNLIQNVEGEGMCIISTSTLYVCDDRFCYHLHIQMNENSLGSNYVAELKDKIASWLCSFIDMEL